MFQRTRYDSSTTLGRNVSFIMAKWIAAEKARPGLRHAVVCPERDDDDDRKDQRERITQSKRTRARSLAIVDWPKVARTCIIRADVVLSFSSGVTLVLFLFRFRLFCFH